MEDLFVNHAAADKELADAVVSDLLESGIGVEHHRIVCLSLDGKGPPSGEDFVSYIKKRLKDAKLVIAVVTPSYLESHFCLVELGAALVLPRELHPIFVPPLTYKDLGSLLINVQSGTLDDDNSLDALRDHVIKALGIRQPPATGRWRSQSDLFKKKWRDELQPALSKGKSVPFKRHAELEESYAALQDQFVKADKQRKELGELVAKLRKCESEDEANAVLLSQGPAAERFDMAVAAAKERMAELPWIVREAAFHDLHGRALVPKAGTDEPNDAAEAADDGFLLDDEGSYSINHSDPGVKHAKQALDDLDWVMSEVQKDKAFVEAFEGDMGFEFDFRNRRFWREHDLT